MSTFVQISSNRIIDVESIAYVHRTTYTGRKRHPKDCACGCGGEATDPSPVACLQVFLRDSHEAGISLYAEVAIRTWLILRAHLAYTTTGDVLTETTPAGWEGIDTKPQT